MEKFKTVKSIAVPLGLSDVDTDMIIPAQYLTSTSREGFQEGLFRRLRDQSSNFVLNNQKYKNAEILIARDNFGCGSSREHAVWAILSAGFKVIIAKSFADIFSANSAKNGLLLVTLNDKEVEEIISLAENADKTIEVSLEKQSVRIDSEKEFKFEYDSFRKHCLLSGLDDLDYLLSKMGEISMWHEKRGVQECRK